MAALDICKNPTGNGAKGRAELSPTPSLQGAREPERARAQVVPWRCEGSRQEWSRRGGALTGSCAQCYRTTRSNPQATLGAHPGSLESFLPIAAGRDRPSSWGMSSRQQLSNRAEGALNSGHAQCCRRRQNSLGTSANLPWRKIPS